jgi:hypothetical protein
MTALPNDFEQVLASVAKLSSALTGREGTLIRDHVQRLAQVLAAEGPDAELRARAATELDQLIAAIARLGGARGPAAKAIRGFDLPRLADGLRTFVRYLRAPTPENQAQAEQLVASLSRAPAAQPVPLDELDIDAQVDALAAQAVLRQGLAGADRTRAIERIKREVAAFKRQLEARTQDEGHRTRTAGEMQKLLDDLIRTGGDLGTALAAQRDAILGAFCRVDLGRMAAGLRTYSMWIPASMGEDPTAAVAALRAQLTDALGPPTAIDALCSEAERQAAFEAESQAALARIFGGTGGGTGPAGSAGGGASS